MARLPNSEESGTGVAIRGDGVAARCCAHLLVESGVPVSMERLKRSHVPVVMLSDATQSLIHGVFGRGDLFADLPRIERRIVAWGPHASVRVLPHSAAIISEETLSRRLLELPERDVSAAGPAAWTVFASRPLPEPNVEQHFGSRAAAARPVILRTPSETSACWVESLEDGWLFLVPFAESGAWLLAVGSAPESLLGRSRLIAAQIENLEPVTATFPAHPRIAEPLCGPGWIACGTAALGFDPLCGDGVGQAIREAILAAAVLKTAFRNSNPDDVLAHYRARLLAGFRRHLELCRDFYEAGRSGPWWDAELDLLQEGITWCELQMREFAGFRYQLRGFELEALSGGRKAPSS